MDLRIDANGIPTVEHASDLTSLRVIGPVPNAAACAALLERGIELTDDSSHAFIDRATLVQLATPDAEDAPNAEWAKDFANMMTYAEQHGWTDERGRIQVHAEWDEP